MLLEPWRSALPAGESLERALHGAAGRREMEFMHLSKKLQQGETQHGTAQLTALQPGHLCPS